ncbi:response regulator transcription factor [Timonella senegalensis]|uniref:response regulator transcription factor n=1 Tax=Timonella senegalensis TaxID=1465825 RepID=UPI0028AB83DE|nr:response regulator transcription factor [Timonella senegalensis]
MTVPHQDAPGPIKVLLVDDHRVVRAGLTAILNESGRVEVVAEAADGGAALELLRDQDRRESLDVVLMDLQMAPGLDGVSAIKAMREAGVDLPVLVLTTYETDADIVAAMSAGAQGYLLKDATDAELIGAVERVAQGRRALSPQVADRLVDRLSDPLPQLSPRELEILEALAKGKTNREIAQEAFVSEATVKTHLVHIYSKLGVDSRTSAVAVALEKRLIRSR